MSLNPASEYFDQVPVSGYRWLLGSGGQEFFHALRNAQPMWVEVMESLISNKGEQDGIICGTCGEDPGSQTS